MNDHQKCSTIEIRLSGMINNNLQKSLIQYLLELIDNRHELFEDILTKINLYHV